MNREIVIVGSGFAGSILARLLASQGRQVLLLERQRHPRFALGESSTPLAAIALERLAERYRQPDLRDLAAHGRWQRRLGHLGCGLKRGFSFYRHHAGRPFRAGADNDSRLLVAASPSDEVADCHWLRADVDAYLVDQAVRCGVEYWDRVEVVDVAPSAGAGLRLTVARRVGGTADSSTAVDAGFVVDASGAGGVVARHLGVGSRSSEIPFASQLVYGHFEGVERFADVAALDVEAAPFDEDAAAVHHLLDEGWMYVLRFDQGSTSAGVLLDGRGESPGVGVDPALWWQQIVARYPAVAAQFAAARPVDGTGIRSSGRLQRRLEAASGEHWALLPHTFAFFDPLFSTGIAWSLLGVERLAEMLAEGRPAAEDLGRYERLLRIEADHQQALLQAAYLALDDFGLFRAVSFLYFAAASFSELRQRVVARAPGEPSWAWNAFLGADDELLAAIFEEAPRRLERGGRDAEATVFERWARSAIEPRNLIGLGDSACNLYGLDLELLVERSPLLGLSAAQMRKRLPELR